MRGSGYRTSSHFHCPRRQTGCGPLKDVLAVSGFGGSRVAATNSANPSFSIPILKLSMISSPSETSQPEPQPAGSLAARSRIQGAMFSFRLIRLLGALAVVGSVLGLLAPFHWIPDIISQLSVQFTFLLVPAAAMAWWQQRMWLSLLCFLLLGWNGAKMVPYFQDPADGLETRRDVVVFRLAVFNVLRTNEQFAATLDSIGSADADFLYLMEVQPAWKPYLESLREEYPYQEVRTDPEYLGVAFLSKRPWRQIEVIDLGYVSNPSIDARIPTGDTSRPELRLIATHPLPPFGELLTSSRDEQLLTLIERFQDGEAQLLCGDFNLSPWSPRFEKLCRQGALIDASLGFGLTPTLIPLPTILGGIKVDHVLRNDSIRVHDYKVIPTRHSDHGIVVLDFSIAPR